MENSLQKLQTFYKLLSNQTSILENTHKKRLKCQKGCSQCCVDGISVFEIEAQNIQQNVDFSSIRANLSENSCVFLDREGACQIYEYRPYVCRTQGLPLRWIEENLEYRDICPLNENDEDIVNLKENDCFEVEKYEEALAMLQLQHDNGKMKRIYLREMVEKKGNL